MKHGNTEHDEPHASAEPTHPEHHSHHEGGSGHSGHGAHGRELNSMAASATLHCLTGCAIGEVLGLIIGTGAGLSNSATVALSIALAFLFGYTLSTLPLIKTGMTIASAIALVFAADTLPATGHRSAERGPRTDESAPQRRS